MIIDALFLWKSAAKISLLLYWMPSIDIFGIYLHLFGFTRRHILEIGIFNTGRELGQNALEKYLLQEIWFSFSFQFIKGQWHLFVTMTLPVLLSILKGGGGPNLASPHGIKLTTPGVKTGIDIYLPIFQYSLNPIIGKIWWKQDVEISA